MSVRMIRKAQIDSSDGATVGTWIREYTATMQTLAPSGVEIRSWRQIFGTYGLAYWTFDAPDVAVLDVFLNGLGRDSALADVMVRGSSLFVSGMTTDVLLREVQ